MGYSPWGCKESDTTEQLRTHTYTHTHYTMVPNLLGTGVVAMGNDLQVEFKIAGVICFCKISFNSALQGSAY